MAWQARLALDREASVAAAVADGGEPWPRISIVTASYNQGQFLEETILSVLQQCYPNLEYIVMDGGSSDDSVEILKRYSPNLHHWVSEPDLGQSDAINKGLATSTGEILTWLNSDDFLAPNALFTVARAFRAAPLAGAVVGIGHKLNAKKQRIYSPLPDRVTSQSLLRWCEGYNFMQPACFFTRQAWAASGPLRLDLNYCMDLALWFKMAERFEFKILDESLAFINTHGDAKTVKERPEMFGEIALLMATQPDGWSHGRKILFDTLKNQRSARTIARAVRSGIGVAWQAMRS